MSDRGWIGVDLDGTLAHYEGWRGPTHIGRPVAPMLQRVAKWLEEGRDVRIFTARVSHDCTSERIEQAQLATIAIRNWCKTHLDRALPVTCMKDFDMLELWDDRAVQVEKNLGVPVGYSTRGTT